MQEIELEISTERARLDVDLIYNFLRETYWAADRSLEQVRRSIENSRCYGVFSDGNQIAFARVVSDYVVFAYIMDVFVLPEFRGRGIAKQLLNFILADPELSDVSVWQLQTRDAHELYRGVGFGPLEEPELCMRLMRE